MSGNIHGISWFPNFPDKFVSWGQEINLYEVRSKEEIQQPQQQKSRLPYIPCNYLSNESRYQYARCVAASYHSDQPIIAVGLADGKIGICNFRDTFDSSWEYTPRQQRMCTCLAWNELDANILAIGHDKHRSDSCITIWDIERGVPKETANFFGLSESTNSLCWDHNHRVLIAGMSQNLIKLFDLRQSNATCQSIKTKAVQGLAVAPNGNYLCSYVDSMIMLWDLRAIERPLRQISSSRNHMQLAWCPTRTSLLSSLQRDSPYITLYDIRSVDNESSREVYHVKRQISPFPAKYQHSSKFAALNGLSWHPRDFERMLLLADALNILDFRLPASLHTAYSNRHKLPLLMQRPLYAAPSPAVVAAPASPTAPPTSSCSTHSTGSSLTDYQMGQNSLSFDFLDRELLEEDLLEETRQRALQDYGMNKPDNKRFAELQLTPYLRNVWTTLGNVFCEERLTGLKSTLGINLGHTSEALMASSRIESQLLQWPDGINNSNKLVCYRSEQRDLALQLCGWYFDQELDRFIEQLYANKEFSRAAMICVFHLKVLAACNILSQAADMMRDPSMYRITAIALSSFNADRCSSTWRNQRSTANMQIQDPHLRAIFSFLTMEKDNFDAVLKEEGVSLADRVAFACKYLSETKLADYIKQRIQRAIECGDLNGLLLTGESLDGINILQSYMDASFDVQTVALVAINYFRNEHFTDNRIQYWIASYLDYLNSWGLWEKRAELDIKIENIRASSRSSRTVYLSCNFCGKSVSNALLDEPRPRSTSTSTNRLSSCPSCRKPLPRCSLCLMHMGTMINTSGGGGGAGDASTDQAGGWQLKPFAKWFSWCQTCRHGGHTEHIMQWFKQNSECPVSSCNCRCFDMDGTKLNALRDIS
ncbi:GATOR2 complex protein MIOS [Drosophila sulfurigaster albostrigata]|uniref:GATOR2 complex protein MIOS n=1 Tax=Drosophila sulfurigaster albostrigata TaxID=89887 RepID=UPI002D21BB16|nr:GATOR2 complex protein MIOS [Drosophila sulfurigaster albostrigata]